MDNKNKFVNLAPVVHPEEGSIYLDAFAECIGDKEVHNIALTGPYGAGKSSVLKRYLKQKPDDVQTLTISLAAFEQNENTANSDLELRILQQIVYSASANELPQSRFRRIQKQRNPLIYALALTAWVACGVGLFTYWREISLLPVLSIGSWLAVFLITLFLTITVFSVGKVMKVYAGMPLKKVSLKNLEFEASTEDTSVLNKYFDEILYFFEVKPYNLVIFEDIDRFNDSGIFVKLRELNALLNNNDTLKNHRHIQFLYAVKDSIFSERERTKFFDFIIPVVPIVGTYNSDKLLHERANQLQGLHRSLNEKFISNVAEYLNDARLIHNTFNELTVYLSTINDDKLDPNVMLAVMLYKNIFGSDFEALHDSKGDFYYLLQSKEKFKNNLSKDYQSELREIEELKIKASNEQLTSEQDLLSICLFELSKKGIFKLGRNVKVAKPLQQIESIEGLVALIESTDTQYFNHNNSYVNPGSIQSDLYKYIKRLKHISNKTSKRQEELNEEIREIKRKIDAIENLRLVDLLKRYTNELNGLFESKSTSDIELPQHRRLMRYLLLGGYLNEDYELYTAIFREQGHWTRNDRFFLTTVRSGEEPEPKMKVDNPKEVVNRLNNADLASPYILNVTLFEYLLKQQDNFTINQLAYLAIKDHYESNIAKEFMSLYLEKGNNKRLFFKRLLQHWPEYIQETWSTDEVKDEMCALVQCLDLNAHYKGKELIRSSVESFAEIFLSSKFSALGIEQTLDNLKTLDAQVEDIASFKDRLYIFSFLTEHKLYQINWNNVRSILEQNSQDPESIATATYSIILQSGNTGLLERVNSDIELYLNTVMFSRDENSKESSEAIIKLLKSDGMTTELFERVLEQQNCIFDNLTEFPKAYWLSLIRTKKFVPTWTAVFQAFESQEVPNNFIVEYLNDERVVERLESETFELKADVEVRADFKLFILNADKFNDDYYIRLNKKTGGLWTTFPDSVSYDKKLILAENGLIALNESSFQQAEGDSTLISTLLISQQETYIRGSDKFTDINHEAFLNIIDSDVSRTMKNVLCRHLEVSLLKESSGLVDAIAPFYSELEPEQTNNEVMRYLALYVSDEQLSLKFFKSLMPQLANSDILELLIQKIKTWSEGIVMQALSAMPQSELRQIASYGKRPTVTYTDENNRLLSELKRRNFISSMKSEGDSIRVGTKRKSL